MVFGNGKVVSRRYEENGPACPGVIVIKLDSDGHPQAVCHTSGSTHIQDRMGMPSFALIPWHTYLLHPRL